MDQERMELTSGLVRCNLSSTSGRRKL